MSDEDGSITETIRIGPTDQVRALLGERDRHLRLLRDTFDVRLVMRDGVLTVEGAPAPVRNATKVVRDLLDTLRRTGALAPADVEHALADARRPRNDYETIDVFVPGRAIRPRTSGQSAYVRAIQRNDLVFCIGPAGTGKTYLAVAMAVAALKRDTVRKIVLTRPALEAGEHLGFLPGDLRAKVNPYLRPLYDALNDMVSIDHLHRYMENDLIEVAPLAYMRGRTLDHAFIILDEGQNCTRKQMKMFLTRLGASSKSVVTGDVSQTDLPADEVSGLIEATHILGDVKGIGFARLTQRDIVRHRLVQDIVDAYEARETTGPPERFDAPQRRTE